MDPTQPDPATLAARNLLASAYLQVFAFARERARTGDIVAQGIERELTRSVLPPPTQQMVRRWLANVSAEARLFNRSAVPYTASNLLNRVNAAVARAGGMGRSVWVEVVTGIRNGTLR